MTRFIQKLRPDQTVTAHQINELIDALNSRLNMSVSSPLQITQQPGGVHLSQTGQLNFEFVELDENIEKDNEDKIGNVLAWNSEASSNPWEDDDRDIVTIADPQQGTYLKGERHVCWFHPGAGKHIPFPGVHYHLGVVDAEIAGNSSGTVSLWKIDSGSEADALVSVTAYDWLGRGVASGTRVLVFQHPQSRRWYVAPGDYPCGDCLAGWDPHGVADADEKRCAGTADITLLSSDEPSIGGTNTTGRRAGYIGPYAWELIHTCGIFTSCLRAYDSPDFLDFNKDFTFRFLFQTDTNASGDYWFWDLRGGVSVKLFMGLGPDADTVRLSLYDGTSTTIKDFWLGAAAVVDTWYTVYIRWKQSTRVGEISVTPVTTLDRNAFLSASALSSDIAVAAVNYGFFVGDKADGTGSGMEGAIDGLVHWQRYLSDCEIDSDYNCGKLRTLPAANTFFTGPGGLHRTPPTISAATEPNVPVGQHTQWWDTTNKRLFYIYHHEIGGQRSVELA